MGEARDEANQDAPLEGHGEEDNEHQPETNPDPTCQILNPVVSTKLHTNTPGMFLNKRAGQIMSWGSPRLITKNFTITTG